VGLQLWIEEPDVLSVNPVVLRLHDKLRVVVGIAAQDLPTGSSVSIASDPSGRLELVDGVPQTPVQGGTFRQRLSWTLEAVAEEDEVWVRILMVPHDVQPAKFRVKILPREFLH
jgi:hypothetical protein